MNFLAIAASMKSTSKKPRREAEKEAEKEFEEPEMNSDFESVSEGEDESDEDVSISNEPELGYQATDEHGKVTDLSSTSIGSICFQIRTPEVVLHLASESCTQGQKQD